jgi:hypothetical protein
MNFHREKCNRYKRLPASNVPKLSQLRPLIKALYGPALKNLSRPKVE